MIEVRMSVLEYMLLFFFLEIHMSGKNFTLLPAVTAVTNLTSAHTLNYFSVKYITIRIANFHWRVCTLNKFKMGSATISSSSTSVPL